MTRRLQTAEVERAVARRPTRALRSIRPTAPSPAQGDNPDAKPADAPRAQELSLRAMSCDTLPDSWAVAIVDWHCAGHDTARGDLESAPTHEVVVPRRGTYVRELRGESSLVDAGTVTFSHPREGYRIRHPVSGGDVCTVFALSAGAARDLLGPEARFAWAQSPLDGRGYLLHRLALRASRKAAVRPAAGLAAEEYATEFLGCVVGNGAAEAAGAGVVASGYAMRARAVVSQRYRERLTLAQIAAAVGCSPFHLSRRFTRAFGVPIWRYVVRLRLRDALERILETRASLCEIGLATGFASQSHFGDAFRAEFGCAPGRVRRLPGPVLAELRARARIR
jgi:AraC-like DNA-binding protein